MILTDKSRNARGEIPKSCARDVSGNAWNPGRLKIGGLPHLAGSPVF